jgi:ribosomal protein S18 acetylase RimI-like enzyme
MEKLLSRCSLEEFPSAYKLMQESFHPAEIRTFEKAKAAFQYSNLHFLITKKISGGIDGLLVAWDLDEFFFLEYLAVQPHTRGSGLGSAMLNEFLSNITKPAILEVEDFNTDIALRRIKLYERLGFFLSNCRYLQPVMQAEYAAEIPLRIMTYKEQIADDKLIRFRDILFEKITPTI